MSPGRISHSGQARMRGSWAPGENAEILPVTVNVSMATSHASSPAASALSSSSAILESALFKLCNLTVNFVVLTDTGLYARDPRPAANHSKSFYELMLHPEFRGHPVCKEIAAAGMLTTPEERYHALLRVVGEIETERGIAVAWMVGSVLVGVGAVECGSKDGFERYLDGDARLCAFWRTVPRDVEDTFVKRGMGDVLQYVTEVQASWIRRQNDGGGDDGEQEWE